MAQGGQGTEQELDVVADRIERRVLNDRRSELEEVLHEMPKEDPLQGEFEQAHSLIGVDQGFDLREEDPALVARKLPERRQCQINEGEPRLRAERLDEGPETQDLGRGPRCLIDLQVGQLRSPHRFRAIEQQGIDDRASAERLASRVRERTGKRVEQ